MLKRKLFILAIVFLTIITVLISSTLVLLNAKRPFTSSLSDSEILKKIIQLNPSLSQNFSSTNSALGAAALATRDAYQGNGKLVAPGIAISPDYKYYYSKSTTTRGPAFNSCNYGVDQSKIVFVPVYESFNYNDGTNYYSKYVAYNEDNSVNNYSLSISQNTPDTYSYANTVYFGGTYAVKSTNHGQYDNSLIKPMSAVEDPALLDQSVKEESGNSASTTSSDLSIYFGNDPQILRTETINGKDYYVIQSSYDVNCAGSVNLDRWDNDTVTDNKTIYTLTYASTDNYQVLKTETYLNSVDASNLMNSIETINDNSNIDFAGVASNFNFDFNVPVKEIDLTTTSINIPTYDPDAEIQKGLDFAKTNNTTLLLSTQNVTNQYVYFNYGVNDTLTQSADNYYADRSFYPAGELGDKMYNSYNGLGDFMISSVPPVAIGSTAYSIGDSSYNLSIYSGSEDDKKILNGLLWSDLRNKNESDVSVTIDGQQVAAKLFSFEMNQPTIMPYATDSLLPNTRPVDTCGTDCFKKQYVLIFSFNGNKYSLQEYLYNPASSDVTYDQQSDGVFRSLSTSKDSELLEIKTLLTNSIKGVFVNGGVDVAPEPLK